MKHAILLLTALSLSPAWAMAQQNDSIPLGQFIRQLHSQGVQVYSLAPDSMKIRPFAPFSEQKLAESLVTTPYRVSRYNDRLFILPSTTLVTELPALDAQHRSDSGHNAYVPEVIASSENQIYRIGSEQSRTDGQRFTLSGTVVNFKTGVPQEGVQVACADAGATTITGTDGSFTLQLPGGYHTLSIRGMNVYDTQRKFQLNTDGIARIELEEDDHMLDEVVVISGRKENVLSTHVGMEKFSPAQINTVPLAMGEVDVLKMVQTLPGIKTVGEASSGYNVRGGATDQNLILFNNGTVFNPTHLFGMFSAFNADMMSDAELFKSSIPAQYGGRISSVLNIVPKEPDKEQFHGAASIGLLTSKAHLEVPAVKGKLSVMLDGRATYSDWMLKLLPEKSGYRNGSAGFYDLGTVISYAANRRNKLNLYGYYSHDRFRFGEVDDRYAYTNANTSLEWRAVHNDRLSSYITAGWDHYDYRTDETSEFISHVRSVSFRISQLFLKAHFNWQLGESHALKTGVNSMLYQVNPGREELLSDGTADAPLEDVPHSVIELQQEKALESAVYLEDEWTVTPAFTVNAGVRYNMFNAMGPRTINIYDESVLPSEASLLRTEDVTGIYKTYHAPEIRLSARYMLSRMSSVKVGFNTMHQFIHKVSNTVIMSPTDTWKLSDNNIKPQSGWQVAGGLYHELGNRVWEFSAEAYYKRMNDYLTYRSGARLMMNPALERDVITTQGYAYGIEVQAKKPLGRLNGWVSYAYSRTFLRQNDPRVALPVNDGQWYVADYDRPHEFKLIANYKFTERYSMSCNVDYSTGRPISIPEGSYTSPETGDIHLYYIERNNYRIPDYFRVDLSFNIQPSHHLTLLTHSSISFGVYNVLGRRNPYSIYFQGTASVTGTRLSIFGAPIPFVNYNIKF